MKRKLIAIPVAMALLCGAFATGAYAHNNGWLSFTGDQAIEETNAHVDEIMAILRQVNADKLSAEDALAEVQRLNPPGLVKQIKALESELTHLEAELSRANQKVFGLNGKTQEALNEAREIEREGGK